MTRILLILIALISMSPRTACSQQTTLKVLIVDGQNNHKIWPKSTLMMRHYLEETGLFEVDVYRTKFTWRGDEFPEEYNELCQHCQDLPDAKTDPDFRPEFSNYDLVLSNFGWKSAAWPDETKLAFEEYVRAGGGVVIVHAANNAWGDWVEYNKMIGVGGWGDRDETSGPYIYYDDEGSLVRDTTPGPGGYHSPIRYEFEIETRAPDHPIMKGIPEKWLHTQDELYAKLRGPAQNITILATAYAALDMKGTGRHEPALMTIDYGKGRIFHTTLGHWDYSMECVGFIVTLQRGAEWAATGEVTQNELPNDFPTADKSSSRKFVRSPE